MSIHILVGLRMTYLFCLQRFFFILVHKLLQFAPSLSHQHEVHVQPYYVYFLYENSMNHTVVHIG
jgi:hypothetical protein